ncbi:MAG TPA: hypothetical protein VJT13_01320 [Xanthobacteraceae bacterium]|nr:hypothetical protein [Xanthobacteraceae bacterium]
MRLPLALASLLFIAPLHAAPLGSAANQQQIKVGQAVICDTSEQAQRFVALRNGGSEAVQAFQLINREAANPSACGTAIVAFRSGDTIGSGRVEGRLVHVVQVTVLAFNNGARWSMVPETVQYAVLVPDGIEV